MPARPLVLLLLALFALILSASARAATLTVTTKADSGTGSLRQALTDAGAGDTIDFDYTVTGKITLTSGQLPTITHDLTITGPGANVLAVDGNHASRVFVMTAGAVAISGLTIQNGQAPSSEGAPFYGDGGGMALSGGTLTLTGCVLTANTATPSVAGGSSYGGGLDNTAGGTLLLTGCTLEGNSASYGGVLENVGTTTLTGCTLDGNSAPNGFGGVVDNEGGTVTFTGCALQGNSAGQFGGGVENEGGSATLTNCTLSGNTAPSGGGIDMEGGTLKVTNCTLAGNMAPSGGGGIDDEAGSVTLTDDILYGDGGGEIAGGPPSTTYCDVQQTSGVFAGMGNISADPLFVNAAGGGLHLQAASPCLGAGTPVTGVTTDKDGRPRPTPPSIGAYENGFPFVSTTGSDANPGTQAAPKLTIQAGIDISAGGDTVTVENGTYAGVGNVDLDFGGRNDLTVTSQNGAALTVIDCGGAASSDGSGNHRGFHLHDNETGAVIRGFTVENGYEDAGAGSLVDGSGEGGGMLLDVVSATVQNCVLLNNTALSVPNANNGLGGGGGIYGVPNFYGSQTFTGCTFTGNTAGGTSGGVGGGFYCESVSAAQVALARCTFTGNTAAGSGGSGGGVGIGLSAGGDTLTLTGCVVSGNTTGGSGGGVANVSYDGGLVMTGCTVTGNTAPAGQSGGFYTNSTQGAGTLTDDILYGDTGGEVVNAGGQNAPLAVTYCDVQGGIDGGDAANHILNAGPGFVSGTDLHLLSTSPVIAQGTRSATGFVPTDHDGLPYFTPPARGAYEGPFAPGGSHVLWDNPDGKTIFWDLNARGAYLVAGTYGPFNDDASGQTAYQAISLSTGPDGVSHLLWTNPDGHTYLWSVNGDGTFTPYFYGPFSDDGTQSTLWKPVAVSTGGDNVTHILWSNPNGRTILWDVAGNGTFTIVGNYAGFSDDGTAGTVWKARALASGPDGLSHVLWINPNGATLLWNLDASDQHPTAYRYPLMSDDGTSNTTWQARALSVGPDETIHVLWNNPNARTILWNVASDGTFTIPGNYDAFSDSALPNTAYTAVALATGSDGLSRFAWDNSDGNTYLWTVSSADGTHTDFFYPPFEDDGTASTVWKAVAVSAP